MPNASGPIDLRAKVNIPRSADTAGLRTVTSSPYKNVVIDSENLAEGSRGTAIFRVDAIRADESKKAEGVMLYVVDGTLLGGDFAPLRSKTGKGEGATLSPVDIGSQLTLSFVTDKDRENWSLYGGADLVNNAEVLADVPLVMKEVSEKGETYLRGFPADGRSWTEIVKDVYSGEVDTAIGRIVGFEWVVYRAGEKSAHKGKIRTRSKMTLAPFDTVKDIFDIAAKAGRVQAEGAPTYVPEEHAEKSDEAQAYRRFMLNKLAGVKREPMLGLVKAAMAAAANPAPSDDSETPPL